MKKKLGTLSARFLRASLRNSLIFSHWVECGARTHDLRPFYIRNRCLKKQNI